VAGGRPQIIETEPVPLADSELLARLFRAVGDATGCASWSSSPGGRASPDGDRAATRSVAGPGLRAHELPHVVRVGDCPNRGPSHLLPSGRPRGAHPPGAREGLTGPQRGEHRMLPCDRRRVPSPCASSCGWHWRSGWCRSQSTWPRTWSRSVRMLRSLRLAVVVALLASACGLVGDATGPAHRPARQPRRSRLGVQRRQGRAAGGLHRIAHLKHLPARDLRAGARLACQAAEQ
jgi:hypothetical protein